jgi:hypothetical protein
VEEGRLMTDDPAASFLRASAIPTGQARNLRDLAAFAKNGKIQLWALDVGRDMLLSAPYTTGVEGDAPVEVEPTVTEPVFVDLDGSGDSPVLAGLRVRAGFTTTEDWSIEFDGTRWSAMGSRSGKQEMEPRAGEAYVSDQGELEFTIEGEATLGDRFELHTETGLLEYGFDGRPTAILSVGDRLLVSLEADVPSVLVIDAWTGATLGSVALPADAKPWRLAVAADGTVFVADSRAGRVYIVSGDVLADPAAAAVASLDTAGPVLDVAWQGGDDADGQPFDRLFVAPLGLQRVDVYDRSGQWIDPNPADAEVAGVDLGSPVSGLSASVGTVWLQQENAWGALPRVPTVVVSTQDGFVFQVDAGTGCAVTTARGPHGPNEVLDSSEAFAYAVLQDQGPVSDAELLVDAATGEQVAVSSCGGVARGETWNVVYDSASVSWTVEGSLSGEQANRAFTDQRYLSDTGAISFFIGGGSFPPTDGDRFSFEVDRGLLVIAGVDKDEDGVIGTADVALDAPARPLAYQDEVGPTGGGWDEVERREYALVTAENADTVARCQLDAGVSQVGWE